MPDLLAVQNNVITKICKFCKKPYEVDFFLQDKNICRWCWYDTHIIKDNVWVDFETNSINYFKTRFYKEYFFKQDKMDYKDFFIGV